MSTFDKNSDRLYVLVTGASSGIGLSIIKKLVELGYYVFAGFRSEPAKIFTDSAKGRVEWIQLDLSDSESISQAFAIISEKVSGYGLDAIINNAGVALPSPIEILPIKEFRNVLEVNVVGTVAVIQQALPLLRLRKGRIINIGSISGEVAFPYLSSYACSKFALRAINDSLRNEVYRWGIAVTLLEIGNIKTPIWEKAIKELEQKLLNLPVMGDLYDQQLKKLISLSGKFDKSSSSPDIVVREVVKCLSSAKPSPYILVGYDAYLLSFLKKILPTNLLDAFIRSQYLD